jgi:hypothetical protein
MQENSILLSTAYFAPIQYYSKFINHSKVFIEQFEHFNKQTYRNRCVILGGNGLIQLIIPVVKGRGPKILIRDLKISYDTNWQRNQWQTLFSAYSSSPFFEYYQDDIFPFFEKKYEFLLDYNLKINEVICDLLEIENNTVLTPDFEQVPEGTFNYRDIISPKNKTLPDKYFKPMEYTQVFSEKHGFSPNLSILDLIFNEGPNSYTILKGSNITP